MAFLAPWILYGLGAVSLPILIHLWQRRRVVQVPLSTLRFLKAIAARTSRSSKLENLLLLLLRCLLFILVIVAAARPVMLAKSARFLGREIPRTIVVLVDNSLSMGYVGGGQSRLETAKSCALALLDELKQGDRVAVIAATDRARLLIAEPTIDRAVARKAIEDIQLTQDRSDFSVALREARKIVARAERGVRQIFLFTDDQKTGWRTTEANPSAVFDTSWEQSGAQLIVVRPDDLQALNASVKQVHIDTPQLTPGGLVRGTAIVENFSTIALHDLVKISIGSQRVVQKPAEVPPQSAIEIPFEFQAPVVESSWAGGSAALSGDNLTGDDACYFTLPVYRAPHALVVEGIVAGPERLRPGYFLRKALGVGAGIQVKSIATGQLEETPIESESVVFLVDPGHLSDRSVVRLERFLSSGGTVTLFPGNFSGLKGFENLSFLPGKPAVLRNLAAGRQPVRIADPTHPLFAAAWDTGTPFPALPQNSLWDWQLTPKARALLTIGSSESSSPLPFLIYSEHGPGSCIIVNASADRSWGDFPLSSAFVPLVQQIARFSATHGERGVSLTVGDPIPERPNLPRNKNIGLILPDGTKRTLPAQPETLGSVLVQRADQQGVYQMEAGDQKAGIAVNSDRTESDLRPLTSAELQNISSKTQCFDLVGVEGLRQWLAQSKGIAPIWPLLLIAALALFAIEGILANLVARRRSQGDDKPIVIGRLNRRRIGVPYYGATSEQERNS